MPVPTMDKRGVATGERSPQNRQRETPILTLDGPSGAGKGAVATAVAEKLGWHYLDSGAVYRTLAWLAQQAGVESDDVAALVRLAGGMRLTLGRGHLHLDGRPVGDEIRSEAIGDRASRVAQLPQVRQSLVRWQRQCVAAPGLVADGRDMGSVVFPQAKCKIFLTANAQARAQRRFNQLRQKGFRVTLAPLLAEINERDRRDESRPVSPLKAACDAWFVDTTDMCLPRVIAAVLQRVAQAYPV